MAREKPEELGIWPAATALQQSQADQLQSAADRRVRRPAEPWEREGIAESGLEGRPERKGGPVLSGNPATRRTGDPETI